MKVVVQSATGILALTLLTVSGLLLSACEVGESGPIPTAQSGAKSSGSPVPVVPTPIVSQTQSYATSPFEELLAMVPDNPETRSWIMVHDYQRLRDTFDIRLPGPGADEEALIDYLESIKGSRLFHRSVISGYGLYGQYALDRRVYLGFDLRNVDQGLEGGVPPKMLEVVRGHFDPKATDVALGVCSECPSPDRDRHHGVPFYSWGEDSKIDIPLRFAPPAFDQVGRGGRIAVMDDFVFRTLETDSMRALIDTHLGNRDSLADVEEFRLLAQGLSTLDAYTGFMSDITQAFGGDREILRWFEYSNDSLPPEGMTSLRHEVERGPLLRPYQAFASGAGKDDKGRYMALVLVHRDADSATKNVGLLGQRVQEGSSIRTGEPWKELVETTDIQNDGRILLAKFYGSNIAEAWLDWVSFPDPLIPHE